MLLENENAKSLKDYIFDTLEKSLKSSSKVVQALKHKTTEEVVKCRVFDADKKARAINQILSLERMNDQDPFKDFHISYKEEVLDQRNQLAHAKSEVIDGIEYLIIGKYNGNQPYKINEEDFKKIRKNLRKYSGLLQQIKEKACPHMII